MLFATLNTLDVRTAGWISQNRFDEIADGIVVALDIDLERARRQIANRPRDRESRGKTRDRIAKAYALHAPVQLEDDAPYALTSARAPFAARINMPLSPE